MHTLAAARETRQSKLVVEGAIKYFFGGNAFVAVLVLALITLFLCREGFGFFGQNLRSLRFYRLAGLEFVDIIREQSEAHASLSRSLSQVRVRQVKVFLAQGKTGDESNAELTQFDQFATDFSDAGADLNGLLSDLSDEAVALKERLVASADLAEEKAHFESSGKNEEAAKIIVPQVNQPAGIQALREASHAYEKINAEQTARLDGLLRKLPSLPDRRAQKALAKWETTLRDYVKNLPAQAQRLRAWDPAKPVNVIESVTSFLFGGKWVTASFWQDWYGIIPLLVGSIMVSAVALFFAVPFGVASALYVSEIATRTEQNIIKPYIEFIAAIPSVVLGFFGIAVVGQLVRAGTQWPGLRWVPFFPISERLNVFTAGLLLALMAVPTIFTLSEDALRNVPRGFKEASYALGANRLQTIARVLVPASLSGIISAILLGLGRVIGETMVVLLCAGNRIAIPDFTEGLGAFFQPVHTMTGIIAQEMGEVVRGSIHYRALFMVGLVLFALTLSINFLAQKISRRFRMSIG